MSSHDPITSGTHRAAMSHGSIAWLLGQAVDLLDRVLGEQAPRLGQRSADHRYSQRRAHHHAQGRVGQRQHPLAVEITFQQTVHKREDALAPHRFPVHHPAAPNSKSKPGL